MKARAISKRVRSAALHHLVVRPKARSPHPYGTHIPTLILVARLRPIRRVLELGGGDFSTPLFLRRDAFPDVECLTVVESDLDWLPNIEKHTSDDERAKLVFAADTTAALENLDPSSFDLILIDDSMRIADRVRTIEAVGRAKPTKVIVAIHDFEVGEYRSAARLLGRPLVVKQFTPQTGLFGLTREDRRRVRHARRVLRKQPTPADADGWLEELRELG